jgi:hypothetical protein
MQVAPNGMRYKSNYPAKLKSSEKNLMEGERYLKKMYTSTQGGWIGFEYPNLKVIYNCIETLFPTRQNETIPDWVKTHYKLIYEGLQTVTPYKLPSDIQSLVEIIQAVKSNTVNDVRENIITADEVPKRVSLVSDNKLLDTKPKNTRQNAAKQSRSASENLTPSSASSYSPNSIEHLEHLEAAKRDIENQIKAFQEKQKAKQTDIAHLQKQSLDNILASIPKSYLNKLLDSQETDTNPQAHPKA